jgi:hypothetical protein
MTEPLTPNDFEPHLGEVFRVRDGRHALTLARVDRGARAEGWPRELFNLVFHGPAGDLLPEGLYTVEVRAGPSFDLYLMPVQTQAGDRQDYQAAFN